MTTTIDLSNNFQIKKEIESIKNAGFIKTMNFKDREGVFKHLHFKASETALQDIQTKFNKKALKTANGSYILEFKKENINWI